MKQQIKISALALVLTVCFSIFTSAQEKLWEVNLKGTLGSVGWVKQSNEGLIIASGTNGLLAMNNNTGETVWHNKTLKGINKNTFLTIDGLPLMYLEYSPMVGKTRGIIMNSSNGDIVFDTKDEGYKIKQFTILDEQGFILFEMMKEKDQILMKFDLKTWKSEWVTQLGTVKGMAGNISGTMGSSFISHGPIITKDNKTLIVGLGEKIASIDLASGKLVWTTETENKIKALVYSKVNNSLYLGVKKSKKLIVYEPATGKDITPGKLKLKGAMLDVVSDLDGNLVLVETEGFNLINPKTGELIWKKSFKINFLHEVIPYEDGYIAIGKDEKEGSIALVDKNGKGIWDTKVKGYAYYITPTASGVLYISTQRSNILSYDKGKDVWDKDVKFKAIPAVTFDDKESKVVLFDNKKGYKFDLKSGEIELFAEDIELEKVKKSTPLVAEYTSTGYFINTDQHASVLSPEGKLIYTKYFVPVSTISVNGLAGLASDGLSYATGYDIDIEGAIDNIKTLSSIANGSFGMSDNDQTDATSSSSTIGVSAGSEGNMETVLSVTKTRYFNSKSSKGRKFMTSKVKTEDSTNNFILVLEKTTGEIVEKIELMDKTPNYIIDEIENRVIVNEKNYLITCIQL